ncbi:MAG: Succinyl-diaminopimelate desuccinylase [Alphaproteobacteria bacterium MarineAlpha5_Bin10]|nr:MAG: Succinyl-diaminopimelate desuccinylase [Alphaproteobacteria bacterium MarineAlpha5_Bin10]
MTNCDPIILTQSLIQCASVTPEDNGVIKCVKSHLESFGCKCEILEFSSKDSYNVRNLFASIGKNGKHFAFAGHTDVVPIGDEKSWKHGPFDGNIVEGRIYGRGSEDMKSAVACFISATEKFINKYGNDFGGRISFIITNDEEKDAINGTKRIMEWIKENNITVNDCIVGEPTSNQIVGDKIKIGRRGSTNFYLEIKGIQGHTANSHRAENPIHHLVKVLQNLMSEPLDVGNEYFLPSSLQIATIDVGNTASNVIPEKVRATINIRFNNLHTGKSLNKILKEKIDEILKNQKNINYSLVQEITGESFLTKPNTLVNIVSEVCETINGKKPMLGTDGGTSDARFIKDYSQVLEIGVVNNTLHKVDESVAIIDLEKLTNIYYEILKKYFTKN